MYKKYRMNIKGWITLLLALVIFVSSSMVAVGAEPSGQEVSVLFSHDMHSHFDTQIIQHEGKTTTKGGFGKLKTIVDSVKANYPDTLLLDAGDFAMGTPFQTIFSTDAAEIRMLGRLGYDATTLGNHEFDYRAIGLTNMLKSAVASGEQLPELIISNIDWDKTLADDSRKADGADLKQALEDYGSTQDFSYLDYNGVTVAVFGLMGIEADEYAPESGLYFLDQIERSKEVVSQIKQEGKADMIICLSHSGTDKDPKKSEDELLAKAVPEIDLIISGHSHTQLDSPIVHGNTTIASCGNYTDNLGHVILEKAGDRWQVKDYTLIPLDDSVKEDSQILKDIEDFRELVSQNYFSKFGYTYDQVLAESPFPFIDINDFGSVQREDSLGNLIADSYIYAVKQAEKDDYRPVDVSVVPSGVVRGSFSEGAITVADAFNVSSLGIGPDQVPGYPLVSIYLTGAELKTVAEIDISVSTLMSPARLYMNGLAYSYNPSRLILNRVTDVWMDTQDGRQEIDDSQLYRVIGGLYCCQMLGAVDAQSFGLLSVVPKNVNGEPITDFEDYIVYDGNNELKEWEALAGYLESFPQENGTAVVPEYYNTLHGRKVEEDSKSPIALLKNPNKIAFMVTGIVILLIVIIIVIILLIVRLVKRRKRKKAEEDK